MMAIAAESHRSDGAEAEKRSPNVMAIAMSAQPSPIASPATARLQSPAHNLPA